MSGLNLTIIVSGGKMIREGREAILDKKFTMLMERRKQTFLNS